PIPSSLSVLIATLTVQSLVAMCLLTLPVVAPAVAETLHVSPAYVGLYIALPIWAPWRPACWQAPPSGAMALFAQASPGLCCAQPAWQYAQWSRRRRQHWAHC